MPHRSELRHRVEMRIDGYTQICLTIIVGLLALLVAGLWSQGAYSARAGAQSKPLTNPTAQRQELIDAQEKTHQRIGQLIQLLEKGDAKIQVIAERKDKAGGQNGSDKK